jgi:hypothetical protein
MARRSVLKTALTDEVKRTVLREAVDRFNHELLDDEERQLLLDRIKRLRRKLRAGRVESMDHHSLQENPASWEK